MIPELRPAAFELSATEYVVIESQRPQAIKQDIMLGAHQKLRHVAESFG